MQNVRFNLRRILVFVSTLTALVVLNLVWVIPTIRAEDSSASVFALEITERARANVESSLQTAQHELANAAEEIALDPARQKIVAELVLKHNPAIKNVGMAGSDGKETFLVDRFDFISPSDLHDYHSESYVTSALAGKISFGDVFISPGSEPHIMLGVPISRAGIVSGVLVSEINIRNLTSAIHTPEIRQGHIYVVDKNGYQTIHPDVSEILRRPNFFGRAIIRKVVGQRIIADGLASEDEYVNEQGESTFTVGMPIAIADLSIFFEQPRAIALAGERQTVALAVGTLLLATIIFLVIAHSTVRLRQLTEKQTQLLLENDQSAKMLVRRDMELSSANTRLLELDKTKSEFVSVAAHQLRTPLTALRWSYHALLDGDMGPLTEDQKKIMQDGLRATLQMIALINDLLNVARIEEGRFGFTFTPQSLEPIIAALLPRFEKIAVEKAVRFIFQPAPAKLPLLFLDAEKMSIVIDNLLDNAFKYTPPGGSITLRVMNEKTQVRVEVEDTGIGIPKDQIHHMFTKFFRTSNAMLLQTSGNGLGLYVSRNIVETHGGDMFLESAEGKGSTFSFTLPVRENS